MRPIKLTMTAFGPYKHKEIIDFGELGHKKLFLITGPTGSGKTTIFDAISFAVYGECSGHMRTAESLRSQFSERDLLTEVELEFELRGRKYHIHRIPKQDKPKKRGEGTTEQKPEAFLTIFNQEPKTIIVGVISVNEKIESLLGINAEQFRQIMMIPQGEFQKLLTSTSEERESVLRQLFDTSMYSLFQNRLEAKSNMLMNSIKRDREIRDHDITNIDWANHEDLGKMIQANDKPIEEILKCVEELNSKDRLELDHLEEEISMQSQALENEIERREKAKEINKKIEERKRIQEVLDEEKIKIPVIKALKDQVKQAMEVQALEPLEENINTIKEDLANKRDAYKKSAHKIRTLQLQLDAAFKLYEEETSSRRKDERRSQSEVLMRLRSYEDKVKSLKTLEDKVKETEVALKRLEEQVQKHKDFLSLTHKEVDHLSLEKEKADKARLDIVEKRAELEKIKKEKSDLKKIIELQSEILKEKEQYEKEKNERDILSHTLLGLEKNYDNNYQEFLQNMAAIFARDLEDGRPCPICGAKEHLELATFSGKEVTEEAIKAQREEVKVYQERLNVINNKMSVLEERLSKTKSTYHESIQSLSKNMFVQIQGMCLEDEKNYFYTELKLREDALLSKQMEMASIERLAEKSVTIAEDIKKKKLATQQTEILKEQVDIEILKMSSQRIEKQSNLKYIYDEVPKDLRNLKTLMEAIEEQEKLVQKMENQLETAKNNYDQLKEERLTIETKKQQYNIDIVFLTQRLKEEEGTFFLKLRQKGFEKIEDYFKAKMPQEDIENHTITIENHAKRLHSLSESLEMLKLQTKDLQATDMASFEKTIETLRQNTKVIVNRKGVVTGRIKNNTMMLEHIKDLNQKIRNEEEEHQVLGHLSNIARGNNTYRITFERYVLAAFLEDIIVAANQRLTQMTDGRYLLSRTQELQRRNAKGSLELEVYDHYTGMNRHVKTLSGGEGFMASLSMALGLADVVQSYAGGVQLDTMFIDEGFGTLDQESLDSAINCLVDLQKTGRLVGIISHVQELKERIDTRLEVHGSNIGSHTRFVVG
ncbi:SbcC/MukB-like Walker B domain-containing protein [Petrocella sp. FN5]|uniref:SbcC/MukB-like Walker B domain-containing protein n=1 Tax=Petrocella sp. FN5 TaxID=3032002 RepID=UPI0023DAC920|nr:SMC family ATPase [Petrocella sp. FN5]MDF1616108.1 SMC family ATPase [Petrocella sp. FN5]